MKIIVLLHYRMSIYSY